jgi:hypothetical protein
MIPHSAALVNDGKTENSEDKGRKTLAAETNPP